MAWRQVALDAFQRLDEDPLSDGGKWVAHPGSSWPTPMKVSSYLARNSSTSQWSGSLRTGEAYANNQQCQSRTANAPGAYGYYFWMVRWAPASDTGYWAHSHSQAGGLTKIYRRVNGVDSQIGSTANDICNNRTCLLEANGTAIALYMDGAVKVSGTDSAIASGYPGIGLQFVSNSLGHDDWVGLDDGVLPATGQPTIARWGGVPGMTIGRRKW